MKHRYLLVSRKAKYLAPCTPNRVKGLYTKGLTGVQAWHLPYTPIQGEVKAANALDNA